MRVLVLTNMYPSEAEPWLGSFVKEQVDDLRALGLEVDVMHFDGRADSKKYLSTAAGVRRAVARRRFDLVHAHYGLTGALALMQRRVPVVTTFHGSDVRRWQMPVSWVVARATTPIFVSHEGARRLGLDPAVVVPCGVDTAFFRPKDRASARRELGWPEDLRYVLLPGWRGDRVKRADLFDAVIERVKYSTPNLRGLSLEGFSREEVVLVMNAVDVMLMTSDNEGSPVAVKESLACMTPVVSVPVGDVLDMIRDLPGCAITARDVGALAASVIDAFDADRSPMLRERAEKYSRSDVARRILAVYERAVGQKSRVVTPP